MSALFTIAKTWKQPYFFFYAFLFLLKNVLCTVVFNLGKNTWELCAKFLKLPLFKHDFDYLGKENPEVLASIINNYYFFNIPLVCCSVTQLCLTLCDPMNCSTAGYSRHYCFRLFCCYSLCVLIPLCLPMNEMSLFLVLGSFLNKVQNFNLDMYMSSELWRYYIIFQHLFVFWKDNIYIKPALKNKADFF